MTKYPFRTRTMSSRVKCIARICYRWVISKPICWNTRYLYSKDITCRHICTDVYIYTWYRPRTCGRRFVCLFLYAFSGCVWLCVSTRTMDIKQKDYLCAMSHVLHTSPGGTYTSKNSRKLLSFLGKDGDWQNYSIFGGNVSSLRIFLGWNRGQIVFTCMTFTRVSSINTS